MSWHSQGVMSSRQDVQLVRRHMRGACARTLANELLWLLRYGRRCTSISSPPSSPAFAATCLLPDSHSDWKMRELQWSFDLLVSDGKSCWTCSCTLATRPSLAHFLCDSLALPHTDTYLREPELADWQIRALTFLSISPYKHLSW